MQSDPLAVLNIIAQAVFDKKGINILALDVQGISALNDYVIIAEGNIDMKLSILWPGMACCLYMLKG